MVENKILEIDLNNLTPQSIEAIDSQVERLVNEFQNPETGNANERLQSQLLTSRPQTEQGLRKIFGRGTFNNLLSIGSNPFSFIQGSVTRLIPFIGVALLVTGVIADFVKKVDDFQKEFINNVDGRINLSRTREQQAEIQAGLQQLIITSTPGGANPRDSFNTFEVFNTDQQTVENDFKIRDIGGTS